MSELMQTPFGDYKLRRIPDNDKNLYAWNAADRYLLKHLATLCQSADIDLTKANILIMNDAFGALSVPLAQYSCDSYSDSFISHQAIRQNIMRSCPEHIDRVRFIKSTEVFNGSYDLVLFKDVKNHTFFHEEMQKLSRHIHSDTIILGSIMAKNLQKNILTLLNNSIGQTQASLTWKKARLLFVQPDLSAPAKETTKETQLQVENNVTTYQLEGTNECIYNLSNVFSRNKLDIGTRFFIEHLPTKKNYKNIIDLGCGNGVLSVKIAQNFPGAHISCVDESYMAIASAKMTLQANLPPEYVTIDYQAANALSDFPHDSADLILCNPPFHQQYVVGDNIAWQMFKQAKKTLVSGGELWIVGNRHLAYHLKLQKIFGNHKLIATNKKFVILKAVKH